MDRLSPLDKIHSSTRFNASRENLFNYYDNVGQTENGTVCFNCTNPLQNGKNDTSGNMIVNLRTQIKCVCPLDSNFPECQHTREKKPNAALIKGLQLKSINCISSLQINNSSEVQKNKSKQSQIIGQTRSTNDNALDQSRTNLKNIDQKCYQCNRTTPENPMLENKSDQKLKKPQSTQNRIKNDIARMIHEYSKQKIEELKKHGSQHEDGWYQKAFGGN